VHWQAKPPAGVTVTPVSGDLSVPATGSASATVTVTAGATDGDFTASFSFSSPSGPLIPVQLAAVIAKPGDLAPYYNITGISNDGTTTTANFDGDGFSYSEKALTKAGLAPGASVTSGKLTYTWPSVPGGQPDALSASGQVIPVSAPAGSTSVGFLGSAVNAGTSGASGTVTVTYTDGTTSTGKLGMSDWTLSAGSGKPQFGDVVVAKLPYRNSTTGTPQKVATYVFADTIPISASKTVASITLPATINNGSIGIFAISAG
jgi:hypothetical protein